MLNQQSINKFKKFRSDAFEIGRLIDEMNGSRESSLAFTHSQNAMMFFGNCVKECTGFTPYVSSMDPSSQVIEPVHIDKDIEVLEIDKEWPTFNQVQATKYVRQLLETLLKQAQTLYTQLHFEKDLESQPILGLTFSSAIIDLIKTKNWMGMVLGKIRDQQIATDNVQ